ncbi:MAG TPA: di-heme oxidoredictase family protein [Acidobacteriota bacterium]
MRHTRKLQILGWLFVTAVLVPLIVFTGTVQSQSTAPDAIAPESPPQPPPGGEAPTGFDNQTNGLVSQSKFDLDKKSFEEREGLGDGLGPVYNAQACVECHQNPVTGAISQITELRAGHLDAFGRFVDAPGGSLINDRAIDASIQEFVPDSETIRTFRTSLNTLGDGFVEAIANDTLVAISNGQPATMRGLVITVPVLEAPGKTRVGRFGWKSQLASLLSFSGDAYLNEMGVTNRLVSFENTSLGRSVAAFDKVADPEDTKNDIDAFAEFMRASKAPPRGTITADAQNGESIFNSIGCNTCHVGTIVTALAGTVINGGAFTVPGSLASKAIHPFGDFLLHNVGTGDGIIQNPGTNLPPGDQSTANRMRTAPLWGVRTRDRLMHDGESLTFTDAILRHAGEATPVTNAFIGLSAQQKQQLIAFLRSL